MKVEATQKLREEIRKVNAELRKNLIYEDESVDRAIDLKLLNLQGYMQSPYNKGMLAERYRTLKWEILSQHRIPSRGKTLLITSAQEGEGKSAASFNLAMSISLERDWQSVLVDTSGGPNSLTARLGLNQSKGLTDYLVGDIPLEKAIYPTSQPKSLFVPVGTQMKSRSELIASSSMEDFKTTLHRKVRDSFLIFDSREVKNYADCRVLSNVSDKILLVVQSCHTSKVEILNSLHYLPKEKLAGVLMTQDPWQ